MSQATSTYIISFIMQNIPTELLQLAFRPRKFNTTVEQRIISEVIEGPILLDTNLVGGKRRDIFIQNQWKLPVQELPEWGLMGTGIQGSYYKIPPEAREYRNISSVVGISSAIASSMPGTGANYNGGGSFGNTATGMLSQMLNTRTFAQYPIQPQITLEGTNILCFYPEMWMEGSAVTVMMEYDSEFLNMEKSGIFAMRNLCLCAVQRYIANKLRVSIDETEVVAGMEIGIIKTLVEEYAQKADQYQELLIKLKGALTFDARKLNRLMYLAL